VVLVTAALSLTLLNYAGTPRVLEGLVGPRAAEWEADPHTRLPWWCLVCLVVYVVLPVLAIRLILRERPADYGLNRAGVRTGLPFYLAVVAVMLPVIAVVSGWERFRQAYPFYPVPPGEWPGPRFWVWELMYAAQFVGLEFFFRGFMIQGTRHRFGVNAVLVMMIPYCMIHFGKPLPEALGAVAAGCALGLISYATRSIWPGAALHVTIAWSMDAAVLLRRWYGM
jgi:membrane protease YdiL (CAAX protease family)